MTIKTVSPSKNRTMLVIHLLGLGILLYLGFWQVERLKWKQAIIANYENNRNKPVALLPEKFNLDNLEFSKIRLQGEFDDKNSLFMFSKSDHDGQIGYFVYTPFIVSPDKVIMVNRGWIPAAIKDKFSQYIKPENNILGIVVGAGKKNFLTPKNDLKNNVIIYLDLEEIKQIRGGKLENYFLIQEDSSNEFLTPKILSPNFHNFHFSYALTWFSLALVNVIFILIRVWR